jgi:hypothetical protein
MKRLCIIVEGQSEQEFVNTLIAPYLLGLGIYSVEPILIHTSKRGRGGFVNYEHLKNDALRLLSSQKDDFIVSMFVDFFRCPKLPQKERYENIEDHKLKVDEMEKCIGDDINDPRFIPYIQLHEFESLLYSSNKGFEEYFSDEEQKETKKIIDEYPNPEDINSSPEKAPSKRLLAIKDDYDKVIEGNIIALEVGFKQIFDKCPRFKAWIERLISACKDD